MNATSPRRRPAEPSPAPVPRRGFVAVLVEHRAGLGGIVVVAFAVIASWIAWERYASSVRSARANTLYPEDVEVVGIGPWILADLENEALRDASLDGGLPLDDPELARRLARAFDIHPWVREVVAVKLRHPAGATVEIRCREPVAMVAVPGGLLPVDAEGILLPSDDFTPQMAARYPKITDIGSGPRGAVGAPWGDPRVEEAAAIASVIGPEWERLNLVACRPTALSEAQHVWELVGDDELVIRFGSAPGHEQPGEPTAALKVVRLRALAEGAKPAGSVDLTNPASSEPPAIPAP